MNRYLLFLSLVVSIGLSGCASVTNGTMLDSDTKKGAAMGALAGAAIGGIVGHQDKHGWEGALIGAAAGGTVGGVTGNQLEKRSYSSKNYIPVTEIVELSQAGTPDAVIISEITRSKSKFDITMSTIDYLKDNGVSNQVIDHMIAVSE